MKNQFDSPIAQALYPILFAICRNKEAFGMDEKANGHTLFLQAEASLDDYRILVGSKGRTVQAIQRLVVRAGKHSRRESTFDLQTNHVGETIQVHEFVYDPNFDEAGFIKLLNGLCQVVALDSSRAQLSTTSDRKLLVVIPTYNMEDRSTVKDLSEVFFPMGFTLGRRLDIKPEK